MAQAFLYAIFITERAGGRAGQRAVGRDGGRAGERAGGRDGGRAEG